MGLKIEDATLGSALAGTESIPMTQGGNPRRFTPSMLWTYIRALIGQNQGTLEFTIDSANCSNPVYAADEETIIGYTTYQHANLIGKVNLVKFIMESQVVYSTERTYTSSTGTIVLTTGMFIPETRMLIEFKKA